MRLTRPILILAVPVGVIALWTGLVNSQQDPWWNPINPYGQSMGVSYGYNLPATVSDGLLAVQLVDPLTGAATLAPTFNIYDWSNSGWSELLTAKRSIADGSSGVYTGSFTTIYRTLPIMDGNDTTRILHIMPLNVDHTGANNWFSAIDIGGYGGTFVGDANATEVGISIDEGYDMDIWMESEGRIAGEDYITFRSDGVTTMVLDSTGVFPRELTFATLGTPANGAVAFCSNCDPNSHPCTTGGLSTGAFAIRQNGLWACLGGESTARTASQLYLPYGLGLGANAGAVAEDALAGDNQMVCYRGYLPYPMTVTEGVFYEYQVAAAGADDYLGFAIYYDMDAGAMITEGASQYAGDGAALVVNLTDVTLVPGWYRFCACQNDVSAQDWLGYQTHAGEVAIMNETVSEIRYGLATNACTGNADAPSTTGALSSSAEHMFAFHLHTN